MLSASVNDEGEISTEYSSVTAMSVSPLPMAVWEAGKVELRAGLCHECVMGELLPSSSLACVMSKALVE